MAENDGKRYYWLKLKKDFFQQHQIKVLKALPNGRLYALIYLELLAESTSHEGELRYSEMLPYDVNTLASVIDEDVDNVKCAIEILKQLELVEIQSDETIYMKEINKLLGSETHSAERMRKWRKNQKTIEVSQCDNLSQNCHQEIRDKSIENRDKNIDVVVGVIAEHLQKYVPEPNAIWYEYIEHYIKQGLSQELIIYAIKVCASNNLRSASYFNGICKNILQKGYKTVEEALYADDKMKKDKSDMKDKARQAYIDDINMKKQKVKEKEQSEENKSKNDMQEMEDSFKIAQEMLKDQKK